jgi:hypothetical protein
LPPQATPLVGPISNGVKNFINQTTADIVASDQFATLWVNVNRTAQQSFMKIAQSGGNPNVDVSRLYDAISANFAGTPLAPLAGKQLPPKIGQINVVTVPALAKIPRYVSLLSGLRWLFLGIAIGFMLIALGLYTDRRRMALYIGLGWMVAVLVGAIVIRIVRAILLGQITDPTYNKAAASIWQALLHPLLIQSIILFIIGAVIVALSWLMGPQAVATRWRRLLVASLGQLRSNLWPRSSDATWTSKLRQYHDTLLWALGLLTILMLLLLTPLSVATLGTVLGAAALIWLILEFLVAPDPRRSTPSDEDAASGQPHPREPRG